MKKFQLKFRARKLDAIGIIYNNTATVVAESLQEATIFLYNIFECVRDLKIVKETETKLPKGIVKHS